MIGLAFAAFQLAAGASSLVVRDANHSIRVPVLATASGPMLRPESLAPMLRVRVIHDSSAFYTLEIFGAQLQLEIGVASVRTANGVRPLVTAPTLSAGRVIIPLQLVSDIFPTSIPNTRWDAETAQLVVLTLPGTAAALASADPQRVPDDSHSSSRPGGSSSGGGALPPVPQKHFRYTVVVDAGHGGVDDGMTGPLHGGPRIYEKDITLAVATKLGQQLKGRGVDVVYTRTTDTLIALDDRGRIANRAAGNLFISIHVNAANPNWKDPGGSRGFETYFLSEARTEDSRRVEQMENAAVRFETAAKKIDTSDPLSFILSDMTQNEHLRESSDLAELIQARLGKMHPGPSRGVKQAGFRVLVTAYMPAVLVEIGFGTNPKEAAFLSDPDKQDEIAAAVADAAMAYLRRYEGRVAGAGSSGEPPR
jgi:N-acetylmuramoyl-L-alanine amidase